MTLEAEFSTDEGGPVGYQDPERQDHYRCKLNPPVAYNT